MFSYPSVDSESPSCSLQDIFVNDFLELIYFHACEVRSGNPLQL